MIASLLFIFQRIVADKPKTLEGAAKTCSKEKREKPCEAMLLSVKDLVENSDLGEGP